jgi:hypothetical protein
MQTAIDIFGWLALNWQALLAGVNGVFAALIVICLLIPGEQPEKFLQAIVDFLAKFSKK